MSHLHTYNPIGVPFIELQSVDSTNNYARSLIHDNLAQHGTVIFAHDQTSGKGQRGKTWTSEKNANIIVSVIINPLSIGTSEQFHLSACIAVATLNFFKAYAGDDVKIKWPNDLYWQDRKAGGILIENVIGSNESGAESPESGLGNWRWAIVGIGININQTSFSKVLINPVSLKQITGKDFKVIDLAKELCKAIDKKLKELSEIGFKNIFSEYNDHLYKKNERVNLKKDNRIFEAIIKGVSPSGKLITHHAFEEEFDFGKIEWIN